MRHRFQRQAQIAVVGPLLLAGAAQAQTTVSPMTLDAAVAYAKEHSPLLAATKQSVVTKQAALAEGYCAWQNPTPASSRTIAHARRSLLFVITGLPSWLLQGLFTNDPKLRS